jgi:hypothetical protein
VKRERSLCSVRSGVECSAVEWSAVEWSGQHTPGAWVVLARERPSPCDYSRGV